MFKLNRPATLQRKHIFSYFFLICFPSEKIKMRENFDAFPISRPFLRCFPVCFSTILSLPVLLLVLVQREFLPIPSFFFTFAVVFIIGRANHHHHCIIHVIVVLFTSFFSFFLHKSYKFERIFSSSAGLYCLLIIF